MNVFVLVPRTGTCHVYSLYNFGRRDFARMGNVASRSGLFEGMLWPVAVFFKACTWADIEVYAHAADMADRLGMREAGSSVSGFPVGVYIASCFFPPDTFVSSSGK